MCVMWAGKEDPSSRKPDDGCNISMRLRQSSRTSTKRLQERISSVAQEAQKHDGKSAFPSVGARKPRLATAVPTPEVQVMGKKDSTHHVYLDQAG